MGRKPHATHPIYSILHIAYLDGCVRLLAVVRMSRTEEQKESRMKKAELEQRLEQMLELAEKQAEEIAALKANSPENKRKMAEEIIRKEDARLSRLEVLRKASAERKNAAIATIGGPIGGRLVEPVKVETQVKPDTTRQNNIRKNQPSEFKTKSGIDLFPVETPESVVKPEGVSADGTPYDEKIYKLDTPSKRKAYRLGFTAASKNWDYSKPPAWKFKAEGGIYTIGFRDGSTAAKV